MLGRKVFWALFATLLAAPQLPAQEVYLGVSAFGGAFIPTADLIANDLKQSTGFVFGGRLSLWTLRRFAVELEGAYALSDLETYTGKQSGSVGAFSMNLVYSIIKPPLEPLDVYLSAGLGLVKRSNDFFKQEYDVQDLTDVAVVVGGGISYAVGRNLYVRVDLKDYISSFQMPYEKSQLQNDLMATAGLELRTRLGSQ